MGNLFRQSAQRLALAAWGGSVDGALAPLGSGISLKPENACRATLPKSADQIAQEDLC